ncbi:histidine phosphatase family protein [Candidatus Parcubacteria bacterium]|nr:MAG: histidine phosphatase family protein [Candidatus Parcubacteria bacterium]
MVPMAKTRILITRHAKTAWNKERRIQGRTDIPILPESKEETKIFAQSIKHHNIKTIYTSTLTRTIQTGKIIQETLDIENLVSIDDLKERSYGKFEGKLWEEITDKFNKIEMDKEKARKTGVEHGEEFQKRIINALTKISNNHPNETILVVCHGGNIRSLLKFLDKDKPKTHIPNNSLFILEFENGKLTLIDSPNT